MLVSLALEALKYITSKQHSVFTLPSHTSFASQSAQSSHHTQTRTIVAIS